jgi:hypothetical protein
MNPAFPAAEPVPEPPPAARVLFAFTKSGKAVFLGHLDLLGVFERALLRAGYAAVFTEGFNPKPRLVFAHPLPLGVESNEEIVLVELAGFDGAESFLQRMNRGLPEGLQVVRVKALPPYLPGARKRSPMALYWGADYRIRGSGALGSLASDLRNGSAGSPRPWTVTSVTDTGLVLRVPFGARPAGVLRILEACGCQDPGSRGLATIRENTWAVGAAGPVSYFDLEF